MLPGEKSALRNKTAGMGEILYVWEGLLPVTERSVKGSSPSHIQYRKMDSESYAIFQSPRVSTK